MELTPQQKQAVEQKLLDTTKYVQFEIHYTTDPALIGGMVIRLRDRVVDGSVRTLSLIHIYPAGGRVAEELVFDDITTGASQDIKQATKMARDMVTRYGMSENIGLICYKDDDDEVFIGRDLAHAHSYSEGIASAIDVEVKRIIDESYEKAKTIIAEHRDVLDRCAALLLEKEKITREEFEALFLSLIQI